jgi:hypothetical protein
MAMPRKKHMDTSISADESELFEAPSNIDARIKALLNHQFLQSLNEIQGQRVILREDT